MCFKCHAQVRKANPLCLQVLCSAIFTPTRLVLLCFDVQTLFCIEVRIRKGKKFDAIMIPMVSGYRYKEIGTFMGHKKYHNPPRSPLTFGLTAAISLHAVTTGYQLQQPFEGGYAYLSGHIQPDVVVAIPTAGPLHDFSSFDFRRALSEAKVHIMSSVVCTVYLNCAVLVQ